MNNSQPVTTISGAIRKRLDEIERRMYEGERQIDIVAELNRDGIKVSLKDFRQLLSRARKARKKLQEKQKGTSETKTLESGKIDPAGHQSLEKQAKHEIADTQQKKVEPKPTGKMSLADIDNLLKNPLDLDNM